jgi:hypothetical protein
VTRLVRYVWALPATFLGLGIAAAWVAAGGTARLVSGVLEVSGGSIVARFRRSGSSRFPLAITFGHVVLGTDRVFLERARVHEHAHVRQYERWGLLFIPLYLLSSLFQLLQGRRPYRDNRFERAAFQQEGEAAGGGVRPTLRMG